MILSARYFNTNVLREYVSIWYGFTHLGYYNGISSSQFKNYRQILLKRNQDRSPLTRYCIHEYENISHSKNRASSNFRVSFGYFLSVRT